MKKLLLAAVLFACSAAAFGQGFSLPIANDSTTGTVAKKPCRLVATGSTPSVVLATSVSDLQVIGICGDGAGTTGNVMVQVFGIVSKKCTFDNATTYGHYVQVASGGGCHDAGASKPTSGAILGTVFDVGGAAGDYIISLNKDIYPSASSTAPICSAIGSSDTITTAISFATVCPIPATAISGVGQILEIRVHGVYTTSTGTNVSIIQINAGGTTGVCQHSGTLGIGASVSNIPWDAVCYLQIVTTGAPGTAIPWGFDEASSTTGGTVVNRVYCNANPCTASTVSFTTNSTQNVTVQQTATLIAGESFTLQSIVVRNY